MIEYVKTILTGQFEATLCMLNECVQKCPQEHWEGRIANSTFRPFSRGELHLYIIRHVQHHTGQMSAYLRRIVEDGERWWVKTGWR